MPWCEQCSRFYNPNGLAPDGTCMTCGAFLGQQVDEEKAAARREKRAKRRGAAGEPGAEGGVDAADLRDANGGTDDPEKAKIPWHFWLLVIALAIYLGWRLIQGIGWLANHL